ncbi:MAG: hypothetical protein R2856_32045 [Caldilineaceae bacterium]
MTRSCKLQNITGDHPGSEDSELVLARRGHSLRCEGDLVRPGGGHISVAVTYTPLTDRTINWSTSSPTSSISRKA